jgi:putative membrane protein
VRYLSWIITIPIALVIVSFAVSNRDPVDLALWPLPFEITVPLYVAVLTALVLGFLAGGLVAWGAGHNYRAAARARGRKASQLERDLSYEREQRTVAERRVAEAAQTLAAANNLPALTTDAAARRTPAVQQIEAAKAR